MQAMYHTQSNLAHTASVMAQNDVDRIESQLERLRKSRATATAEIDKKNLDALIEQQEDALDEAIKTRDEKLQAELKAVADEYSKTISMLKQ
jgi:ABC-type phosphate transport system auxiliary subunit